MLLLYSYIRTVKSEFMQKEIRVVNPEQKLAKLLPVPQVPNRYGAGIILNARNRPSANVNRYGFQFIGKLLLAITTLCTIKSNLFADEILFLLVNDACHEKILLFVLP